MAEIIDDTTGRVINTQEKEFDMHLTKREPNYFLLVQEDYRKIFDKLMNDEELKKLLFYSTPDAIEREDIKDKEQLATIAKECIRITPEVKIPKEEISCVTVLFNNFAPNYNNPMYVDNNITFEILCPLDCWKMDNYQMRPFRILHRIHSLFADQKLNGIGRMEFITAQAITLGSYSGFSTVFSVTNEV